MKTVFLLSLAAVLLLTVTGCTMHSAGISAEHGYYYHYRSPHKAYPHHKTLHHRGRPVVVIPHR